MPCSSFTLTSHVNRAAAWYSSRAPGRVHINQTLIVVWLLVPDGLVECFRKNWSLLGRVKWRAGLSRQEDYCMVAQITTPNCGEQETSQIKHVKWQERWQKRPHQVPTLSAKKRKTAPSKLDSWRLGKCLLYMSHWNVKCDMQMVESKFGISMTPWSNPVLS